MGRFGICFKRATSYFLTVDLRCKDDRCLREKEKKTKLRGEEFFTCYKTRSGLLNLSLVEALLIISKYANIIAVYVVLESLQQNKQTHVRQ